MTDFTPTHHPWNQEVWDHLSAEGERTNHAVLLTGHRGLGKVDLGFARVHQVITEGHAQSKSLFDAGSHPDVHVLMPEDKLIALGEESLLAKFGRRYLDPHAGKPKRVINIEQVRKLGQALTTHPHISSHRVIFIPYAEMLNRNAANGLLKNLEEPPAKTLFVLVTNEISKLPKTIRSRCSLVNFRTPEFAQARTWLEKNSDLPTHEIDNHLAMANNQPLLALQLYKNGYVEVLKNVFSDVNGLWNRKRQPVETAKNWQDSGAVQSLEILQKLCTDLLRVQFSEEPAEVFFPVQQAWVKSVGKKLSQQRLLSAIDELTEAKRLLATTVDELLVLESVAVRIRQMPSTN